MGQLLALKKGEAVMKLYQRFILGLGTAAVCLSFAAGAAAEGRMSIEELQAKLNLTQEQVNAIVPIIKRDRQKRQEIIDKYRGQGMAGIQSIRKELFALQKEHDEKYSKILTEEQMKKYIELRKQESAGRRAENRSRRMNGYGQ